MVQGGPKQAFLNPSIFAYLSKGSPGFLIVNECEKLLLICDINSNSKPLTLANIYAPNKDDPNFFHAFLITYPASTAKKL